MRVIATLYVSSITLMNGACSKAVMVAVAE